jgi:elongation factor P--(R)-beta-lysine ligase
MMSSGPPSGGDTGTFRPTASLERLQLRSELLDFTRAFFRSHGLWEVETPLLSHDVVVDAYLEPFATHTDSGSDCRPATPRDELFLQTSPEFGMKRLVATGASAIFQITRSFRRGEIGPLHNPEFTILEWYRTGSSYHQQMAFVEEFVIAFCHQASLLSELPIRKHDGLPRPFPRVAYDELFRGVLGAGVLDKTAGELAELTRHLGIEPPPSLAADDVDGWLNLLLALKAEPELSRQPAIFVHDYPPGQAALARIRPGTPPIAERFELYLSGVEICNGYQELTDPRELRRRITVQQALRQREGNRPLPAESRLIAAMDAGLPDCSGVALGFDRLLMAAVGATSLSEVMAFPFDRA